MKSIYSIIKTTLGILLFAVLSLSAQAQNPTYLCELRNDAQTSDRTFEFDIYIQRTGTTPFELNFFQFGINVNSLMLNGGTISASMVSGTSNLTNTAQIPTPIKFSFNGTKNCIIMTATSGPGPGSGSIISNLSPGTRFCRVLLTNTVPFGICQPNLTWSFLLANGYQTKMFAYVSNLATDVTVQSSHTTNYLLNPILNSAPTAFAVTGGGSYCQGGLGLPVGLANSQVGVTYTLLKNNVALVPTVTVAGTGTAITFGNQLEGTYTVSGTNGGGTTAMTLSAVITAQAVPNAGTSGLLTICTGSTVTQAQLFTVIGTHDAGGVWTPVLAGAGIYTYTVAATAPCTVEATSTVTVTGQAAPSITIPGSQAACDSYTLPVIGGSNLAAPAYYNNSQALGGTVITGSITSTQTSGFMM